ncbi:epoxyqueuosine reductase QueH [Candidatus Gracilibacteria bacterium]|nr:epoxyqueuosine reductase QueH [Candidatus Gracilibacteria bacterium]
MRCVKYSCPRGSFGIFSRDFKLEHLLDFNSKKPKLLLHSCCAPCLTHPLEELRKDFEVTIFFYNPNIHPHEEYEMRLAEAKKYCNGKCEIIEEEYDSKRWFNLTRGLENEPERGKRCQICYEMRLAKTAEVAVERNFHVFATTLSISPHKNAKWLNEIGEQLAEKFGIKHLTADWKKRDGFKKSLTLSRTANLHRQNYCGCAYSIPH